MTSPVEICSNALLLIGHAPIASLTEGSDRANLMSSLYTQVRRATIRSHVWNFAKWSEALAPDVSAPFDYAYRFLLPGDCLRALWIGERGETHDYDIQGRTILFDEDPLYLTYLRDVEDPNSFDAMFIDALCANLAFTGAYPLTKSVELQKAMYALYAQKKADASTINGQELPPAEISSSYLLNARRARGRGPA